MASSYIKDNGVLEQLKAIAKSLLNDARAISVLLEENNDTEEMEFTAEDLRASVERLQTTLEEVLEAQEDAEQMSEEPAE